MAHPGGVRATFMPASQPDIIRAAQKDAFYQQVLHDRLQDVSRRWLGARRAIAVHDEVSLLSSVLFHAVTTGAGVPTLGEEYCDLHAVAGEAQRPVSAPRRALLVALQTLVPYWLERERRRALSHPVSAHPPPALPPPDDAAAAAAAAPGGLAAARAAACAAAARSRAALRRALPHLEEPLSLLSRAHLALFYLSGTYYSPAYRLAGVRRVFVGRLREPPPHYRILGILLAAQVAAAAAMWARRAAARAALPAAAPGVGRHAVLLDAAGRATALDPVDEGSAAAAAEVPAARPSAPRCALCLSARRAPTATPCGHVFCWPCVVAWTATKPECPLCRSPAAPQELAPIYNMA